MHSVSSIYMRDIHSEIKLADNQDILFESSSTIKLPIIYLAIQKAVDSNTSLNQFLPIEPRHKSNGSGIINWTNWKKLTLAQLIASITTYSDCVATNVLIEFVGGKRSV